MGRAAAAAGSLLHVKPLIGYRDGGLISDGIAQGRKRSMQRVRELFCRYVEREGLDLSQYYVVTGCGLDEEEYRVFTWTSCLRSWSREAGPPGMSAPSTSG